MKILSFFNLIFYTLFHRDMVFEDFKVESVRVVRVAATEKLFPYMLNRKGSNELELLEIKFSAKDDLVKLAKTSNYYLSYKVELCGDNSKKSMIIESNMNFFVNGKFIDGGYRYEAKDLQGERGDNGAIIYTVFAKAKDWRKTQVGVGYDKAPGDICVKTHGGSLVWPLAFDYSDIVVSGLVIKRAIDVYDSGKN